MTEKPPRAPIQADFSTFLSLWNQRQKQTTPGIHFRIADWLELNWGTKLPEEQLHLLLMAFRSCGKSTLVGLYAAWLLYRQPDLRIIVLAADGALAGKMVRNIKRIIERHPLTGHLKPPRADQWASDRFTVKRGRELRDPSVIAYGVTSNITGARADVIICDDVEVPNTCDTAERRAEMRERLLELDYILVPGGMQLYVGTPHSYYSIYAKEARAEIGEERPFLEGFERLEIPLLDADGNSAWPERFRPEDIERMKQSTGLNKFTSQMMLKPVNILEGRLNPKLLRRYEGEIAYVKELNRLEIENIPMHGASAYWDPAFGSPKGDGSVVAVVFRDGENNYYLHRLCYLRIDCHSAEDAATQQCKQVAQICKELMLPRMIVEGNGIGKMLPGILKRELASTGALTAMVEHYNHRAKELRILEAFDVALVTGQLYVHQSVYETPFVNEMQEWVPGKSTARDDGLDAVAGAIAAQPERLDPERHRPGNYSWSRSGKAVRVKTVMDT